MASNLPSLFTRHILRPSLHTNQPQLKQLFPNRGGIFAPFKSIQYGFHSSPSQVIRTARSAAPKQKGGLSLLFTGATVAGVGLSLAYKPSAIHCDAPQAKPGPPQPMYPDELGKPPSSSISVYELGFGTVAGICAGVFMKKGAKALAFLFGGVFVLLQYLGSASLVRVDWGKAATKFENAFHTKDPKTGVSRAPNVFWVWTRMINFLTADFQPRASFVAGFALGLRIGLENPGQLKDS